jgi:hypothetical protein
MAHFFSSFRLTALFLLLFALPQMVDAQSQIHIIPAPKVVKMLDGKFTFTASTSIVIENLSNTQTAFAASELASEIKTELGFQPLLTEKQKGNPVTLLLIGRDTKLLKKIRTGNLTALSLGEEGYFLHVSQTVSWLQPIPKPDFFTGFSR